MTARYVVNPESEAERIIDKARKNLGGCAWVAINVMECEKVEPAPTPEEVEKALNGIRSRASGLAPTNHRAVLGFLSTIRAALASPPEPNGLPDDAVDALIVDALRIDTNDEVPPPPASGVLVDRIVEEIESIPDVDFDVAWNESISGRWVIARQVIAARLRALLAEPKGKPFDPYCLGCRGLKPKHRRTCGQFLSEPKGESEGSEG